METLTKFKSRKTAAVDARAGTGRPETEYLLVCGQNETFEDAVLDIFRHFLIFYRLNNFISVSRVKMNCKPM